MPRKTRKTRKDIKGKEVAEDSPNAVWAQGGWEPFREYRKQLAGARGRLLVIVNLKNLQKLIEMISDSLRSGPGEGTDLLLIIKNLEVTAPDSL